MTSLSLARHDREIGEVVAVTSVRVVIEIHDDLTSPIHSYPGGQSTIAQIGAYLCFPIGAGEAVVGVIVGAFQHEGYEPDPHGGMTLQLAKPRRTLQANLLGTLGSDSRFRHGVAVYPTLGSPALVPGDSDLSAILDASKRIRPPQAIALELGTSPIYETVHVSASLDDLFSRPLALVGNTGSGKSWSVASAIQRCLGKLEPSEDYHPRFIVLDVNGEYGRAFSVPDHKREANQVFADGLPYGIPLWAFNLQELIRYFDASAATQVPVLDRVVTFAREDAYDDRPNIASGTDSRATRRQLRRLEKAQGLLRALVGYAHTEDGTYVGKNARDALLDLNDVMAEDGTVAPLCSDIDDNAMLLVRRDLSQLQPLGALNDNYACYARLTPSLQDAIDSLTEHLDPLLLKAASTVAATSSLPILTADVPYPYDPLRLDHTDLFDLASSGLRSEERMREYVATLRLRIRRKLQDRRWAVFRGGQLDLLNDVVAPLVGGRTPSAQANPVTVVDCSMLAHDVLPFFCAVLARVLLDVREHADPEERILAPWVLVLEEAHNYLRPRRESEDAGLTLSREAFERIAKEGRKFGLSLIIASQRPADVSETVLSQCANFVVHRIQNPDDIAYFKRILPGGSRDMLDQVSILTPGEALLLGSAVNVPCRVRVWEPNPAPRSETPQPSQGWRTEIAEKFKVGTAISNWTHDTEQPLRTSGPLVVCDDAEPTDITESGPQTGVQDDPFGDQ